MDKIRNRAGEDGDEIQRLPGGLIEAGVIQEVRHLLRQPEIAAKALAEVDAEQVESQDVIAALNGFDSLWTTLFPAERARIIRLLVERVTVGPDGVAVDLRTSGLAALVSELLTPRLMSEAA